MAYDSIFLRIFECWLSDKIYNFTTGPEEYLLWTRFFCLTSESNGIPSAFMFLSLTLTCASMTNIKAPQPPNIYSESKVWSKKSICPGKSHIWNCINELLLISTNSKQSGLRVAAQHFYQAQTCASMTNIKAPQPPNIQSESKVGSKKSMCPGRSQIENCMNEFDVNSVTKQQTGQVCTSSNKKQRND